MNWWPTVLATGVYLVLSLQLVGWIIDDAGISFAYARSLGHLHGLVSQPGMAPVEGYSNPLWVIMLAPFFATSLFHPYFVPKLIALGLVVACNINLQRALDGNEPGGRVVAATALLLLNTSAPFVIWTCSGLENALYAATLAWQFRLSVAYDAAAAGWRDLVVLAAASLAAAFTRPDGIVFIALPVLAIVSFGTGTGATFKKSLVSGMKYICLVVLSYASFLVLRLSYYGRWTPNTYAAKGGRMLDSVWAVLSPQEPYITKMQQLFQSVWGTKVWLLFPLILGLLLGFRLGRTGGRRRLVLNACWAIAGYLVFMLLPSDWMPEHRFATPFLVFIYALIAQAIVGSFYGQDSLHRARRVAAVVVAMILVMVSVKINLPRFLVFSDSPPVAFKTIADRYAFPFNAYAEALNVKDGSILLPDVGGTLYYSDLKVYDLVGLTDSTIARTLKNHKSEFYNYVFERIKPTFIHFHGNWNLAARLYDDPRFARDYVAISEYDDKFAERVLGRPSKSGDYLRREIVEGMSGWRARALEAARVRAGENR